MGVHPRARFRPVSFVERLDRRELRRAVIAHTNGGGSDQGSLLGFWNNRFAETGERVGAHFQVMSDGTIEQYADTDLRIDHAFDGSRFAVGIETQDDNDPSRPWTKAQIDAIVDICNWLEVPPQQLAEHGGDGIGWHRLHDSWNKSHHTCPGDVRLQQLKQSVIPRLGLEREDLSIMDPETKKFLDAQFRLLRLGDVGPGAETHPNNLQDILRKINETDDKVDKVQADILRIKQHLGIPG